VTPQQQNLDQYREAIEPLRKVAMIVVPAIAGPSRLLLRRLRRSRTASS
jgi:hypothetical protein